MSPSVPYEPGELPHFEAGETGHMRPDPRLRETPRPPPPQQPQNTVELIRLTQTGHTKRERRPRPPRVVLVPTTMHVEPAAVAGIVAILVVGLFLVGGVIVLLQNWQSVMVTLFTIGVVLALIGLGASQS